MNKSMKLRATAAVTFAVIGTTAYLLTQYAAAQKPASLSALPIYPFVGSSYSIDDIAPADRARAEDEIRRVAASAAAGYQPVAERFLAVEGDFIWDAVRSSVGGYLSHAGFHIHDAGQNPDLDDAAFIVWDRTNRLRHLFNPGKVVAVGLQTPMPGGPAGDHNVHVYAYFELRPKN